jgi:hypothetical protein
MTKATPKAKQPKKPKQKIPKANKKSLSGGGADENEYTEINKLLNAINDLYSSIIDTKGSCYYELIDDFGMFAEFAKELLEEYPELAARLIKQAEQEPIIKNDRYHLPPLPKKELIKQAEQEPIINNDRYHLPPLPKKEYIYNFLNVEF